LNNAEITFPACIEIEKVILSSLFQCRELMLISIPVINADWFYNSAYKKIFETIKKTLSNDAMILFEALPECSDEIAEITSGLSNANIDEYVKIIRDRFFRRKLITSAIGIISSAENDFEKTAIEISENGISDLIINDDIARRPETIKQICPRLFNNLKDQITGHGMQTYLSDVDKIIGIFQPGEYIILAGRPSMGKTALSLCIARSNSKNGYPVLIFSLETTKEIMCGRVIFGDTECSYDKILRGNTVELQRSRDNIDGIINAPIYIDDTSAISIGHIESVAEEFVKNYGVKMIVIDHVGLMKGNTMRSRHEELSQTSKSIKAILKKLNVPGIILCQLSRKVEDRSPPIPVLSDLRESGSFEEDSDKVLFIYREEYYKRESEKKGIAEIVVAKNKNGRTGFNEVVFDKETMNFRNLIRERLGEDYAKEQYYQK